jgi:hypothetical protein
VDFGILFEIVELVPLIVEAVMGRLVFVLLWGRELFVGVMGDLLRWEISARSGGIVGVV